MALQAGIKWCPHTAQQFSTAWGWYSLESIGRHPEVCNHTVLSWLLPTRAQAWQNRRIQVQNVKALLSLTLSHEVLLEKGADSAQARPSLPSLHTKNSPKCDNTQRVWLKLKSSEQRPCEMQSKHTDRFTANYGFLTLELLKTIQQLGPALQVSLSFRRTVLAPCLLVGSELPLYVSAQQWGFGPA